VRLFQDPASDDDDESGDVRTHGRVLQRLHSSPCIYQIENLLTPKEVEHFISIADEKGRKFKSSFVEDDDGREVISEERTSQFVFMKKGADSVVRAVEHRLAEIVGMSSQNVEPLQIVRYVHGQRFNEHHDAGTLEDDGSVTGVPPRRIITYFIYLTDLPEGHGGHTEFTQLPSGVALKVCPKKGRAVLWSNVDAETGACDPRTAHRGCPVLGDHTKLAMNVWITDEDLQMAAL